VGEAPGAHPAGGGIETTIREAAPGRFEVAGNLTFASARHAWESGLSAFEASGASSLQVDLSAVRAADSAGLAVLLNWRAWAHAKGRKLAFARIPPSLVDLARISEAEAVLGAD